MKHTGLAVIESGWGRKSNVSVRELFGLVANISCGNSNAFHYETANSKDAFKEIIPRIATYRECKYLYIATHGNFGGLKLLNKEMLNMDELRDLLISVRKANGSKFQGIYLASCLVGTEKFANFLFEEDIGVNWIACYKEDIDWIQSAALDLLFFNELLYYLGNTELQRVEGTAERLLKSAAGLIRELGFGIYTRKRSKGGAKNLLESAYSVSSHS